jgi:hypothetical protein
MAAIKDSISPNKMIGFTYRCADLPPFVINTKMPETCQGSINLCRQGSRNVQTGIFHQGEDVAARS